MAGKNDPFSLDLNLVLLENYFNYLQVSLESMDIILEANYVHLKMR